ncbi:MAG: hypothetical protein WBA51_10315 [Erythrobacter sp.]
MAVTAVAIEGGLWIKEQLDEGYSIEEVFSELYESIDGDTIRSAGTVLAVGALGAASLKAASVFLGPVGVAAVIALDVALAWDDLKQAVGEPSLSANCPCFY